MASPVVETWVEALRSIGAFQYILPFLITFFVTYGLMEKVQPFGSGQQRVQGLLAAVIGLFLIAFAPGSVLGAFFSNFIGALAVVLVALVLVMTGYGLVFGEPDQESNLFKGIGAIAAVSVIILFFVWGGFGLVLPSQVGGASLRLGRYIDLIIVLALLGLLAWALMGEGGGDGQGNAQS